MLLPKLVPSCRRLMWRTTAVALKACCGREGVINRASTGVSASQRNRKDWLSDWCRVLTLHLLLAKFFRIWRLTDSWMFLQSAVPPAILKIKVLDYANEYGHKHSIRQLVYICICKNSPAAGFSYLLGSFIFILLHRL